MVGVVAVEAAAVVAVGVANALVGAAGVAAGVVGVVAAGCCGVARVVGGVETAAGGVGKTSSSLAALPAPTRAGLSEQWASIQAAVDWPTAAKRVVP